MVGRIIVTLSKPTSSTSWSVLGLRGEMRILIYLRREKRGEKDILHVAQSNIQGAFQLVYQVGCVTKPGQSLRVVIEQRDIEGQDNMVFLRSSLRGLHSWRS